MSDPIRLFDDEEVAAIGSPALALVRDYYAEGHCGEYSLNYAYLIAKDNMERFTDALSRSHAVVVPMADLVAVRDSLLEVCGYRREGEDNGGNPVEDADPEAIYARAHQQIERLGLLLGKTGSEVAK